MCNPVHLEALVVSLEDLVLHQARGSVASASCAAVVFVFCVVFLFFVFVFFDFCCCFMFLCCCLCFCFLFYHARELPHHVPENAPIAGKPQGALKKEWDRLRAVGEKGRWNESDPAESSKVEDLLSNQGRECTHSRDAQRRGRPTLYVRRQPSKMRERSQRPRHELPDRIFVRFIYHCGFDTVSTVVA